MDNSFNVNRHNTKAHCLSY